MMIASWEWIAAGSEISASSVKIYAHHIVPTITVIHRPKRALKRTIEFLWLTPRNWAILMGGLRVSSARGGWVTDADGKRTRRWMTLRHPAMLAVIAEAKRIEHQADLRRAHRRFSGVPRGHSPV